MKVLHIYRTYYPDPPGGLQEAIRQIAAGCKSLGAESTVYTLSPTPIPDEFERPEARVRRAKSWYAPASCDLGGPRAYRLFRECVDWADVLHFHYPWPFADVLNLAVCSSKPKVMTYHSDVVKQKVLGKLYSPLMRHTISDMDAVVATSPTYARTSPVLARHVDAQRLHVIPLCMGDVLEESVSRSESDILDRLNLRGKRFVLSLGVLRYYKGLHVLLEAARELRGTVVLAGSGPEEARLRQQAKALGLQNVVFAGMVSEVDKHALLRHCTLLALPSHLRSEAFGMVLLEAAMYSRPLVSCEIGTGTSYNNLDGETGFVVPPENPQALARAINTLLDQPDLAMRLGAAARLRYETHFTPRVMSSAYMALYHKVLGR